MRAYLGWSCVLVMGLWPALACGGDATAGVAGDAVGEAGQAAGDVAPDGAGPAPFLPRSGVYTLQVLARGPFVYRYYRVELAVDAAAPSGPTVAMQVFAHVDGGEAHLFSAADVPVAPDGGFEALTPPISLGGASGYDAVRVVTHVLHPEVVCGELIVATGPLAGAATTFGGRFGDLGKDASLPTSCEQILCLERASGLQCLTRCAGEHSCPDGQYCNPAERVIAGERWPAGVCVASEDCVPGQEATRCADAASTCGLLGRALACAPAGEGPAGAPCGDVAFSGDTAANCGAGLLCAFGACRPACGAGCQGGETCIDWGHRLHAAAAPVDVCLATCDLIQQSGCGPGEVCGPTESVGDQLVAMCGPGAVGTAGPGEPCEQTETSSTGTCGAGQYCSWCYSGTQSSCAPLCVPLCTVADTSRCPLPAACRLDTSPLGAALGHCPEDCAPFPGTDCPGDLRCVGAKAFVNVFGDEVFLGHCGPRPPDEVVPEGGSMKFSIFSGTLCDEGLIIADTPDGPMCRRACAFDGRDGATCPAGSTCQPAGDGASVWGFCDGGAALP